MLRSPIEIKRYLKSLCARSCISGHYMHRSVLFFSFVLAKIEI